MDEKRKKQLIVGTAALFAVIIFSVTAWKSLSGKQDRAAQTEAGPTVRETNTDRENEEGVSPAAGEEKEESEGERETKTEKEEEGGTGPAETLGEEITSGKAFMEAEEPTEKSAGAVSFPCSLENGLVVTKIASYDGIFIEDGSDESITGVAAMAVENTGTANVEYAEITVKQGERTLVFKASVIPAGATVVVMEAGRAAYEEGAYQSVTAKTAVLDSFEMSEGVAEVSDNGDHSLTVTNLSGQKLPCVRIFYKYYMDEAVYVGGIAYVAKVTDLEAGESRVVKPAHFVSGSSRVLMIRNYETAE